MPKRTADSHALPEDGKEMITFRLGRDGSMSESRKDGKHWEYGSERAVWPTCIQGVADHMAKSRAQEGWQDAMPWFWIVRVTDLKQALPNEFQLPH